MGPYDTGHQHRVAWVSIRPQTVEGHQRVDPKDSLFLDRLNLPTSKEI